MDRGFVRVYCNRNLIAGLERHSSAAQSCAGTGLPGLGCARASTSAHDWLFGCQKRARQQGMGCVSAHSNAEARRLVQRIGLTVLSPGEACGAARDALSVLLACESTGAAAVVQSWAGQP